NIHAVLNRLGDYALSDENRWLRNRSRHIRDLAQRMQLTRELNPKLVVSLHTNWSRSSSSSGFQILRQKNEQSKQLAEHIRSSLKEVYSAPTRITLGKTFYLLNYVKCPAVI